MSGEVPNKFNTLTDISPYRNTSTWAFEMAFGNKNGASAIQNPKMTQKK
jgi:hypothetical protein